MIRVKAARIFAIIGAVAALSIAWLSPLGSMARDLFVAHMLQHLLLMNVAALLIAVAFPRALGRRGRAAALPPRGRQADRFELTALAPVTAIQVALFWMWHMPGVVAAVQPSHALHSLMQSSLFAVALFFWWAVLGRRNRPVWPAIFALLVTAKAFCLLGAAYVFSRRTLYPLFGSPQSWGLSALEDQQLAGLLMVSACALVYVVAAIWLFAAWFVPIESLRGERSRSTHRPHAAFIAE